MYPYIVDTLEKMSKFYFFFFRYLERFMIRCKNKKGYNTEVLSEKWKWKNKSVNKNFPGKGLRTPVQIMCRCDRRGGHEI